MGMNSITVSSDMDRGFIVTFITIILNWSLVVSSSGSQDDCKCINPFNHTIQSFFGEKELACKHGNYCFVDCGSKCEDVFQFEGFLAGKCGSKIGCSKSNGSLIVITGTGEVSKYQGHSLGLYQNKNEFGYYEQVGGDFYLVQDTRSGDWYTHPHGCDRKKDRDNDNCFATYVGALKANASLENWKFGKDKKWTDDSSITFENESDSSCLQCNTIKLNSIRKDLDSNYTGTFVKIPIYSAGRPVYLNADTGKYLMMKNEFTTFGVWDDIVRRVRAGKGEDNGRGLRSLSGPTCVTEVSEKDGWEFKNINGYWVKDSTFIASCID